MPSAKRKVPRLTPRATFSAELRDAIDRDGRSPYAIARSAEVAPGILSRFLAGHRAMTTDTLDRLAAAMGLHLAAAARAKGRPRRAGVLAGSIPTPDGPTIDQELGNSAADPRADQGRPEAPEDPPADGDPAKLGHDIA